MRAFRHALDPDAADEAAIKRYHRAGITLSPTLDGTFYLRGTADETTGALIADAINHASPLVTGDTRTAARRRLDGLADMCRHYLDHPDTVNAGPTGRRRTQLILTTDPTVFTTPAADVTAGNTGDAGADTDTDTVDTAGTAGTAADAADDGAEVAGAGCPGATLSWAGWITAATARRAACDSHTTFVSLGPDGDVVEAGTQRRFFTPAQRRAIIARDGDRCPAPYCDRPITWSDAHHLTPVEQGGPTTITNGALPCEAHHLMLHEGH